MPLGVSLCLRSRLASCFSCRRACCSSPLLSFRLSRLRLLLASHEFPIVMAPRIASRPAPLSSTPIAPPIVSNKRGDISCGVSLLAWHAMPFLSKYFPRQSFKTFLSNVLKTFQDNLLETAKHIPLPMSPCPPFCGCVAPCRRLSSRCSLFLVYDLSLLKRRVFPIASRLSRSAPRPVMRHARRPPRILIKLCSFRSSPSASARPRFSPIESPPRTPRLTDTQNGEKNGERDGCLAFLLILSVAIILL